MPQYVNQLYEQVPQKVEVVQKEKGKLMVQMDELWSFVDDKKISNGFGLRLTRTPVKLLVAILAIDARRAVFDHRGSQPKLSGTHCPESIDNVPRSIRTTGRHIRP